MAWKPPIIVKSISYWNGDMEIRVQAARHFQFVRTPFFSRGAILLVETVECVYSTGCCYLKTSKTGNLQSR